MITLKNQHEIQIMKDGGRILRTILKKVASKVKPGITTKDLEILAKNLMKKAKVKSSFIKYQGYPAHTCISINDEVVHGIPTKNRKIKKGDIVGIDMGLKYKGFNTDAATTVPAGKIKPIHKKLISVTRKALKNAILKIKPNNHISDIGEVIQKTIEKAGFEPVKECSGHGIGRELHEEPSVPNFKINAETPVLKPGMALAIEPMATEGKAIVKTNRDGWTISTVDGGYSAHFEHTIVVTDKGCIILA